MGPDAAANYPTVTSRPASGQQVNSRRLMARGMCLRAMPVTVSGLRKSFYMRRFPKLTAFHRVICTSSLSVLKKSSLCCFGLETACTKSCNAGHEFFVMSQRDTDIPPSGRLVCVPFQMCLRSQQRNSDLTVSLKYRLRMIFFFLFQSLEPFHSSWLRGTCCKRKRCITPLPLCAVGLTGLSSLKNCLISGPRRFLR